MPTSDGSSTSTNVYVTMSADDTGNGEATFAELVSRYDLMEMQGDLSPIDAKLKEHLLNNVVTLGSSSGGSRPIPMGTFILPAGYGPQDAPPAKKTSCCLRLGTLSLPGEVGPPMRPMAVLRRLLLPKASSSLSTGIGEKRPRGGEGEVPVSSTSLTSKKPPLASFATWYHDHAHHGDHNAVGDEDGSSDSSTPPPTESTSGASFELVGVIKKRFHFKTKPTRQF